MNKLQFSGKLIKILPLVTGVGKNGNWKKQDLLFENNDKYQKKIMISIWGDKVDTSILIMGNNYIIEFEIESREYNGKWYTDLKAWKISEETKSFENNNDDSINDRKYTELPF